MPNVIPSFFREITRIVDLERWRAASTASERLQSISWARAIPLGVSAFGLATVIWVGLVLFLGPRGIEAHPPPLPNEAERQTAHDTAKQLESRLVAPE